MVGRCEIGTPSVRWVGQHRFLKLPYDNCSYLSISCLLTVLGARLAHSVLIVSPSRGFLLDCENRWIVAALTMSLYLPLKFGTLCLSSAGPSAPLSGCSCASHHIINIASGIQTSDMASCYTQKYLYTHIQILLLF